MKGVRKRRRYLKSVAGKGTKTLDRFGSTPKGKVRVCTLSVPLHVPTKKECAACPFQGTWCSSIFIPKEKVKLLA